MTTLLKPKPWRLIWPADAEKVFMELKTAFTTAPILHDPEKLFVVEVDSSESGVGAVLSQRFGEKDKMYPVAYPSPVSSPWLRGITISGTANYLQSN